MGSAVAWYELEPGFAANFHLTETGEYFGSSNSSRDISNDIDLTHLKQLRRGADALVVGGATARAEGYKPTPRHKTYVFSRHPKVDGLEYLSFASDEELSGYIAFLKNSHGRVLSECGPSLLNKLLSLREVDALFLTVTFLDGPNRASAEYVARRVLDLDGYKIVKYDSQENSALMLWRRA